MNGFRGTIAHTLLAGTLAGLTLGCASAPAFKEILPGVRLDRTARLVSVDGAACLDRGILEYVAVAENGKEYESLFRLRCRPAHLQQALLMAGFQVGEVTQDALGDYADKPGPEAQPPHSGGSPRATRCGEQPKSAPPMYVTIDVEVEQPDGSWKRQPIESFMTDRRTGRPPARLCWIFTGSYFARSGPDDAGVFAADHTLSVIALWYDPSAVLNLTEGVGNPYRGAAAGLEVNPDAIPPRGTCVRLVLREGGPNPSAAHEGGSR